MVVENWNNDLGLKIRNEFIDRHEENKYYLFLKTLTSCFSDYEESVSNVYTKLLSLYNKEESNKYLSTSYLFTCIKNDLIQSNKRNNKIEYTLDKSGGGKDSLEEEFEDQILILEEYFQILADQPEDSKKVSRYQQIIDFLIKSELSEDEMICYIEYHAFGYTYVKIGEMIGRDYRTVKRHIEVAQMKVNNYRKSNKDSN